MNRAFTGRHMAAILVAFFAVVITVNFAMARFASATFGGVVVENSYVASQHFNRWLDEAAAEKALGWEAEAARLADGRLELRLIGAPEGTALTAIARHPLGRQPDRALAFHALGGGRFRSAAPLPQGRWELRLEARSGRQVWREEIMAP